MITNTCRQPITAHSRVHHNGMVDPASGSEHGFLTGEDTGGWWESITSSHTLRPQDVPLPEVPASGSGTTLGE
jgi:hypothetical protein